ncbi:MAG: hypothetical protein DRR16_23025 [Candidatus Parabeggiatoa sp. nov. 3]|nr:MAG: hypothetical protein DRR00_26670 [Gammaproteobacteria bacterium]RKZ59572.1 MAG: hypothetical protein DRQ99_23540 [Gammaproteobacteria bacterium]RKZ80930.1 MAG: hypothetical protein DRR16_23025 [Gammaproteobacteria bacterium]
MRLSNALFLVLFLGAAWVQAEEEMRYKPYVLASTSADSVKTNLQAQGFKVVGEYEPYADAKVIVVTNDELKTTAAQSSYAGYGAIMRVAITNGVVSYTNPPYWANAYQMKTELGGVVTDLKKALGNKGEFGSEYGMSQNELRQYYYAPFMADFDETVELETYPTYQKCTETVEAGLKSQKGDKAQTQFVYRVNIPNKNETVFGMAVFGESEGADTNVMTTLNESTGKPEHTAYMPYEILCSGTKALMLHGKFRIAISFPDLKMWPFMMIRGAPDGIKKAAKAAAAQYIN